MIDIDNGLTADRSVGFANSMNQAPATTDDLTPKQAAFVSAYLEHGNASRAYREVFDASDMLPATIKRKAFELVHSANVANRVRTLQAAAAEHTVISVRARMVYLQQIVEADPSELVSIAGSNCRWCWGAVEGEYQWRTPHEWSLAAAQAYDAGKPIPTDAGGFGFRGDGAPNPSCARCDGEGITRTVITPTDQLSPSARRLFKGARQKANGEIEILMHDQLAAADQLNRMQAAYTSVSLNANINASVATSDLATPDALLEAYNRSRVVNP